MTIDSLMGFWGTRDLKLQVSKFLMMAVAGLILGILGPYGTSDVPGIILRFLYWLLMVSLLAAICGPVARRLLPAVQRRDLPVFWALAVYCAVVSIPIFLVVILVDLLAGSPGAPTLEFALRFLSEVPYGPLGYLMWFGQVFIITFLIVSTVSLVADRFLHRRDEAIAGTARTDNSVRFMNRLPVSLGTDLRYLSMEDHYLRVHTSLGNTLILMRMADAVEELAEYPGMQVHRSWWVANDAIQRISRDKRRYTIHLDDGRDVPLSQSYVESVRKAGYL